MKRVLSIVLLALILLTCVLSFTACGGNPAKDMDDVVYVEIDMQSGDYIKLELYTSIAPITVANFVGLAWKPVFLGEILKVCYNMLFVP